MKKKEISITVFGASGFIGQEVCRHLSALTGYRVIVVERNSRSGFSGKAVKLNSPELDQFLAKTDVVINFSGANIIEKAWTESRKKELWDSRVMTTRMIKNRWIKAIAEENKKKVGSGMSDILFLNASAIGYYNKESEYHVPEDHDIKTEASEKGNGFLSDLTEEWERAACFAENERKTLLQTGVRCRSAQLRFGLVLGMGGGALPNIVSATKWFMGTVVGRGEQIVSWIALSEIPAIINFIIHHMEIEGPVNVTAPQSLSFRQFSVEIGKHLRRPVLMRIPGLFVKKILGDRSDLVLKGDRVYPEKLMNAGYVFKCPNLTFALKEIL